MNEIIQKVAERHLASIRPGEPGQGHKAVPPFDLWWIEKHTDKIPVVERSLRKAAALYASVGCHLPPILVLLAGRPGGSSVYQPNGGYIQIGPSAIGPKEFYVFIHEIAHAFHFKKLGRNNKTILAKYKEAMDGPDILTNAQIAYEDAIAAYNDLAKPFRKGMVVNLFTEVDVGVFPHVARDWRKAVIIGKRKYRGEIEIGVAFDNPSPTERRMGNKIWKSLSAFAKALGHDSLVKTIMDVGKRRNDAETAMQKARGGKYEVTLSNWVPTAYAKKDHMEWFAELVTTRLLNPSILSPMVKAWVEDILQS